ncbi:MAG: tetratricopeptide repeat protein [Gammaproteobacteria bacterium]|nr:tetratricopeptide repeat protein [Gammaproteobacteria bacterium]MCH9763563.1 tetratricopeptide repeat protein [Gammaproteobacteria bacterium]
MSIYMTEDEQLEAIKDWWKRNQRWITMLVSGALLLVAGYRYWAWHTDKVQHEASQAYEQLMVASSNQEAHAIEAYAKAIVKEYPKTVYGDAARLMLAKHWVTQKKLDDAVRELEQVVLHAKMPALKQVARIRLARLWIAEKTYDKALNYLEQTDSLIYKPLVDELKGDVYAATGRYEAAEALYREAREEVKLRGVGNVFLEMKTNELATLTGAAHSA